MRHSAPIAAAVATLALAGCAVPPPQGPSVIALPPKDKPFAQFQQEDLSCRQAAAQQIGISPAEAATESATTSAVVGTVLGAAAGAAIGAAAGNPAAGAAIGAGSGLFVGGATGASAAQYSALSLQQHYDITYAQCMYSKGNSVPNVAALAGSYPYGSPYSYPYGYPYYPYYGYYPYYPYFFGPSFVAFGFGHHFHHHHR